MNDPTPYVAVDLGPTRLQLGVLLGSAFVVAACGLAYELMMGTVASTLLGATVLWFSLTIGVFLSAMGIGSWVSRYVKGRLLLTFVLVEVLVGVVGAVAGPLVFWAYTHTPAVHVVLFGTLFLIGGLVGLEIPLLTRFLEPYGGLRRAISSVMALDYLGALVASVAFPLLLLPWLGLLESFFAVGLLNLLVAGMTVLVYREELPWRVLLGVIGLSALGLGAGLVQSETAMSYFERRLYADTVILGEQTPYQRIVLTRRGDDVRMYLNGHLQFSAVDEFRYHEALVHPAMQLSADRRQVLLLGAGDGLALREVLRFPEVERVVLVDLDPAVTRLASEHPDLVRMNGHALSDPRVEVVNADAFGWLGQTSERFGVIVADFPDPHDHELAKLYSTAMYGLVRARLAPGGVAVTQSSSPYFAREVFWCVVETVRASGLTAEPYHAYVPAFGEWGFVLMAERPLDLASVEPVSGARFLTREMIPVLTVFPEDMAALPVGRSTLDDPIVATYHRRGWRSWF